MKAKQKIVPTTSNNINTVIIISEPEPEVDWQQYFQLIYNEKQKSKDKKIAKEFEAEMDGKSKADINNVDGNINGNLKVSQSIDIAMKNKNGKEWTKNISKKSLKKFCANNKKLQQHYNVNNCGNNDNNQILKKIDLHDQKVNDAVKLFLSSLQALNIGDKMIVVTGRGKHSKNNKPQIRDAIRKFCNRHNIQCEKDGKNSGAFVITKSRW